MVNNHHIVDISIGRFEDRKGLIIGQTVQWIPVKEGGLVLFMMFNATFNNISFISWRSVLLVEETGENQTCRESLTKFIT
jgi:hypothetical protein